MKVKILNPEAKVPTKAYSGDAGFDVYALEDSCIFGKEQRQLKLGIAIEIAEDEVAIMSERSGMAIKSGITSIGNVIDSGYRGEISIILANITNHVFDIKKGDKIGQIIIHKLGNQTIEIVNELSDTERGNNAHYSSGVK